jgi:uncharacterized protein (DUF1330 family)
VYHQLVFIWIRDPAMFAEYLRALPPVVARFGGAADLSLRPTAIWADDGLTLPDVVNLVHYDDREAFERFGADPGFRAIEPLRAGSVDLYTFEGQLSVADPSPPGAAHRLYNVELATYRDGSGAAYRDYEQIGEARMRHHGYHVEYRLDAETAPLGRPRPDVIKISSFPDPAAKAAFEADPAHAEIEQKLYPAGADNVVWLTGHVAGAVP